jgi:hypothetical protein
MANKLYGHPSQQIIDNEFKIYYDSSSVCYVDKRYNIINLKMVISVWSLRQGKERGITGTTQYPNCSLVIYHCRIFKHRNNILIPALTAAFLN